MRSFKVRNPEKGQISIFESANWGQILEVKFLKQKLTRGHLRSYKGQKFLKKVKLGQISMFFFKFTSFFLNEALERSFPKSNIKVT